MTCEWCRNNAGRAHETNVQFRFFFKYFSDSEWIIYRRFWFYDPGIIEFHFVCSPMDENTTTGTGRINILPISDEPPLSPVVTPPPPPTTTTLLLEENDMDENDESFRWTTATIFQALIVFIAAGIAEIGGGYLVWKAIRGSDEELGTTKKRWFYAIFGSIILVLYGFIPTLQPTDSFGRIYAVYGGFFIVLSFLAGWYLDNDRPDLGDIIGGSIALAGVLVVLFWPR